MKKILLQTTIPYIQDDWSIERFSTLAGILSAASDEHGNRKFEVVSRNRDNHGDADDSVLKRLNDTDFDQLWLFGVDVGGGITPLECEAIARFRTGRRTVDVPRSSGLRTVFLFTPRHRRRSSFP